MALNLLLVNLFPQIALSLLVNPFPQISFNGSQTLCGTKYVGGRLDDDDANHTELRMDKASGSPPFLTLAPENTSHT